MAHGHTDPAVPPRRSGGPRTERGKKKASRNATKHGIFSHVVLPEESETKYRDIVRVLLDYINLEGYLEEIVVENSRLICGGTAD
jgi:hypothetical protein